ncbi:hypothetical protein PCASD_22992 [Puccinia coronata f. sp. avenae]|nr:hypothetical protein PCASD_22992 [Puccinia coronata f. sp. avenae]
MKAVKSDRPASNPCFCPMSSRRTSELLYSASCIKYSHICSSTPKPYSAPAQVFSANAESSPPRLPRAPNWQIFHH